MIQTSLTYAVFIRDSLQKKKIWKKVNWGNQIQHPFNLQIRFHVMKVTKQRTMHTLTECNNVVKINSKKSMWLVFV